MLSPSLPERGTKEIHSLSESARERDRLPFFVVCLLCSMIAEPAEKVNESPVSFRSQPRTVTFYAARSAICPQGWARPVAVLGGVCVLDRLPVRVV